jgi:hypothetical protein
MLRGTSKKKDLSLAHGLKICAGLQRRRQGDAGQKNRILMAHVDLGDDFGLAGPQRHGFAFARGKRTESGPPGPTADHCKLHGEGSLKPLLR